VTVGGKKCIGLRSAGGIDGGIDAAPLHYAL
jgi:hypothetical protein